MADRLFKLRHCQNIQGVTRQLALFDAPIDPGLLIRTRAAGVDIGSVLSDMQVSLPNYRYTALYPQALDFVNAVRGYGGALLGAINTSDSNTLADLLRTQQQALLQDNDAILQAQVQRAEQALTALNQARAIVEAKLEFNESQDYMNAPEITDTVISGTMIAVHITSAVLEGIGAGGHLVPNFVVGASGFGGSPHATGGMGGSNAGHAASAAANAGKATAAALTAGAALARLQGGYMHRMDAWKEAAKEARLQLEQTDTQIAIAQIELEIAQKNREAGQKRTDDLQAQIDYLTSRFTNQDLLDWMVAKLSETYFQSYRLAYRLCKQVERCYQFELGIQDSSFIEFGYWDSLRKGLQAGESLNHDLRRMQASYLDNNSRRFEISRFISLATLDAAALARLLATGACDFDVPESLLDHDYPGHYNRHLVRVSVTVAYPNPTRFDNVKATLTLAGNKVRISTDVAGGYAENPPGADARFVYNYAAVPQRIVLSNAQDDPGLFLTSIGSNLGDPRYLPFERAGVVSSWHFELPAESNEIDLANVTDVILHLYYTALDGGDALREAAKG